MLESESSVWATKKHHSKEEKGGNKNLKAVRGGREKRTGRERRRGQNTPKRRTRGAEQGTKRGTVVLGNGGRTRNRKGRDGGDVGRRRGTRKESESSRKRRPLTLEKAK